MEEINKALSTFLNSSEEAFNDPIYNRYDSGPGANLDLNLQLPYKNTNSGNVYKLFVTNIPKGLTEIGLKNIFSKFGTVKNAFFGRSKSDYNHIWGMVEYDNLKSAQEAIKGVNLQPPYKLQVKFAISESEKERRLMIEKKLEEQQSVTWPEEIQDEEALVIFYGVKPQILTSNTYTVDTNNDHVLDYTYFNHFSQEYLCDATHRLFTNNFFCRNQHLANDSDDDMYCASTPTDVVTPVSYFKNIIIDVEDEAKSAERIEPVFNKECDGMYEFGASHCQGGKCEQCSIQTATVCKACETWCCGDACLMKHAPFCSCAENNKEHTDLTVKNNISKEKSNYLDCFDSTEEFIKPKNITEYLKEGYSGLVVQLRRSLSKTRFIVTLVCTQVDESLQLLTDVPTIIETFPFSEINETNVGEIVALENVEEEVGTDFPRGYIFSSGKAVLCDFGDVVTCKKIKRLPQNICAMPSLAVYCTLLECNKGEEQFFKEIVRESNNMQFEITKCFANGTVEASFMNNENINLGGKLLFSPMFHFAHVVIKTGSAVTISAFYNCATVYVQSAEPEAVELFDSLVQEVMIHCILEKEFCFEPLLGDMVAVYNTNSEIWLRAQILKKNKDGYLVIYVDFGNVESVSPTNMKPLNNYLKNIPCCAVRIGIADIPHETSLNIRALQLLFTLCETKMPMKIEYSDCNLQSVKLIWLKDISLGQKLLKLNVPKWKKALDKGLDPHESGKLMHDNVIQYKLIVGKEYRLCVTLCSPPDEIVFYNVNCDVPLHVMNTLSAQLKTYCESLKTKSYNPQREELCIVKSDDGCWYRAMCLFEIFETVQSRVMFLDFGNQCIVTHQDIRPFCKDFINTPAMAIYCTYAGISENCSDALKKRMKELIKIGSEYTVVVKSLHENSYYFTIDIPSVTSVLVEEKLL